MLKDSEVKYLCPNCGKENAVSDGLVWESSIDDKPFNTVDVTCPDCGQVTDVNAEDHENNKRRG